MLFADAKGLRPGSSTFADAQRIAARYSKYVVSDGRPCKPELCLLLIRPTNFWFRHRIAWHWLSYVGVRPDFVELTMLIQQSTVVDWKFEFIHFSRAWSPGLGISAEIDHAFSLAPGDRCTFPSLHPYPEIGGWSSGGGNSVTAFFTPRASLHDQQRALDLRLSCISSISDCSSLDELMPSLSKPSESQEDSGSWVFVPTASTACETELRSMYGPPRIDTNPFK